jgi:hypothetical protein
VIHLVDTPGQPLPTSGSCLIFDLCCPMLASGFS